jgi:hypothetical protein
MRAVYDIMQVKVSLWRGGQYCGPHFKGPYHNLMHTSIVLSRFAFRRMPCITVGDYGRMFQAGILFEIIIFRSQPRIAGERSAKFAESNEQCCPTVG